MHSGCLAKISKATGLSVADLDGVLTELFGIAFVSIGVCLVPCPRSFNDGFRRLIFRRPAEQIVGKRWVCNQFGRVAGSAFANDLRNVAVRYFATGLDNLPHAVAVTRP